MSCEAYGTFTIAKLKLELVKRGLPVSGKKSILVKRLDDDDKIQNLNTSAVQINLPPNTIPTWPISGFKQITEGHKDHIPEIGDSQIEWYFMHRQAMDLKPIKDVKALEKGNLLLNSCNVEACSLTIASDACYFTGVVRATMKKKVKYNYRLKLELDGSIANSECDCAAGMGPHATCKHIGAVILALKEFKTTGNLLIARSCTETLQSFNKPKHIFKGSPYKASELPGSLSVASNDPRPDRFRNLGGYNASVRSNILNFCANENDDLTMRFRYGEASLHGASHDHDYLKYDYLEYWVDDHLKQAQVIEQKTRGQSSSAVWFEERLWRITASSFGSVCKATERRDYLKLCETVFGDKQFSNDALEHGRQNESIAINDFEKQTGYHVRKAGLFILAEKYYLGASPDGIIDDEHIIEIKSPYTGRHESVIPCLLFPYLEYRNDKSIGLKRNHNYFYQVQGQLYITQTKFCYFVVHTKKDLFIEKIEIDHEFLNNCVLPKLHEFYREHYVKFIVMKLKHCF